MTAAAPADRAFLGETTHMTGAPARATTVDIEGEGFLINGRPTYAGRTFEGVSIEGLLLNARMRPTGSAWW
jgi:hypothetical protein